MTLFSSHGDPLSGQNGHASAPADLEADRVLIQQGRAQNVRANHVEIRQGGAAMITAEDVHVHYSGVALAVANQAVLQDVQAAVIAARNLQTEATRSVLLLAGRVEGNVNTVISAPVVLAAGAAAGAIFGLIVGLLSLLKRNA